jgi:hypothetical protein
MSNPQSKKVAIGQRQARALCTMSHAARLNFIAEGLSHILGSAQSFWNAAEALGGKSREAAVLEGFAEEEAAKGLVLLDIVPCPRARISERIGRIVGKIFYDHLARLIYAKAQSWRQVDIAQLQEYVDSERQAQYLEGGMSEYILPNWAIYSRESALYTDIEVYEDGVPQWSDPTLQASAGMRFRPPALSLLEALSAIGLFKPAGLQALSDIWGRVDFVGPQHSGLSLELAREVGARLDREKLVTNDATDVHVRWFFHNWQMPMYNLDFALLPVTLEELEAARQAAYWAEIGYTDHAEG